MRTVLRIAACQLRMELRDRSNAFWMFLMPLAFIGLFGGLFRGENPNPKPFLRVIDRDRSFLSAQFVEILKGEDLTLQAVSAAAADTVKGQGRSLILPAGFSDSLEQGRKIKLPWSTVPGQGEDRDMAAEIQADMAIARMLATLAEYDTVSGGGQRDFSSPAFQGRFQELRRRPDSIQTHVSTAGKGRAVPSGVGGSSQAMLVLFLLMNASMSGAVSLTQEKQGRVLARLAAMPVTHGQILGGKILGFFVQAMVQAGIILLSGRLLFRVWWGPSPGALLLLLLCLGFAAAALGVFLGGWLRSPEQAGAIGWLIPLFLGAIGGTWWPLEIVPGWMRLLGHLSPAAWAMDGLHGLINFGQGGEAVLLPCGVLLLYGALLTVLASRLLRVTE